jgi:alkylation response protein AidB-like acyl-CoA dehydrogenase
MTATRVEAAEDLDSFRRQVRDWLATDMARTEGAGTATTEHGADYARRVRELQRKIYDGGLAGITYPRDYGGLGRSVEHLRVFNEESAGYEMPFTMVNMPTLTILGPTLIDFGTEDQKRRHLPAMLRGDELWCQLLSEPTGGSDMAGALTQATRDGDVYYLNGSKIWTSYANHCDFALCLARTDWDAPKHRGLTTFIVDLRSKGVEIRPIKRASGESEFCQEFLDDVEVPAANIVGALNDGWTVASRLLIHERISVGGGSPYAMFSARQGSDSPEDRVADLARRRGLSADRQMRDLVGEAAMLAVARSALVERISSGQKSGKLPGPAGSITKLFGSTVGERISAIGVQIAGVDTAAWSPGDPTAAFALDSLARQGGSLGGGSSEMQRNIIAERILGMPREPAPDRELPFSQVRHNTAPNRGREIQ